MQNQILENLIVQIQEGHIDALDKLYDLTHKNIYGYIYSIVASADYAQDLTHDVYIQIYKKAKLYQNKGHVMAWILTISRNITYMALRKSNREKTVDYDIDISYNNTSHLNNQLLIHKMINILKSDEKEIIVLRIVEELTFKEIASMLDMKLATVLAKYHRSLKKLKKHFGGEIDE